MHWINDQLDVDLEWTQLKGECWKMYKIQAAKNCNTW